MKLIKLNPLIILQICLALFSTSLYAGELPAVFQGVHRIVFLGDSITQAGDYVTDFDCWLVSQGIQVEVLNLGLASETASDLTEAENAGHLKGAGFGRPFVSQRLDRVLAESKPDLLLVCYGMNDGSSLPADDTGMQRFAAAVTHLRETALKSGVKRVVLCSPPVQDARANPSNNTHDENLTRYSIWLNSKRADGWDIVDIHGPMRKALDQGRAKDPSYVLAPDSVHPNREGHWMMAKSVLTQFVHVEFEGITSSEQLFKNKGKEIRDLVRQRMDTLFAAWMSKIGHTRPGVPGGPGVKPGLTVEQATEKAETLTKQILEVARGEAIDFNATNGIVQLGKLNLGEALQEWGGPAANRSVDGRIMQISGVKYTNGFGTHARSVLWIDLHGSVKSFTSWVGIDDEVVSPIVFHELRSAYEKGIPEYTNVNGRVIFQIYGDGKLLWKSKLMLTGMPAEKAEVDLTGVQKMVMVTSSMGDAVDYDHADWAEAQFMVEGTKPKTIPPPREEPYILTPAVSASPRINGAKVFGVRPGSPFLFTIPATGDRPMSFRASGLPKGLRLDSESGRITGALKKEGQWKVMLTASNASGSTRREFRIVCGDTLALTPPMGWNTWNVYARDPDDAKVRAAADAMVKSGLINHGWTYINIDDCWQNKHSSKDPMIAAEGRDANGMILPNKKFPEMKGLCDYIHSKGLKAGIYSSPGIYTCQGHTGSFMHEEQDARQYAAWGFDYLKYDWCYTTHSTKNISLAEQRIPWQKMSQALRASGRDIIFSLSETLDVWPWAKEVGANAWRTTGDITDTWSSIDDIGFRQNGLEMVAGPGHWNDCDMFVVGKLGGGRLHSTRLSPDELYTHISLWCLLSSPLLIGCDMNQLDDFTLNLLSNDEVLEVNQDPLGCQAHRISKDENVEVWGKNMEDGTKAVGLFNRGETANVVKVNWSELGLSGPKVVRDLWRQKDEGSFEAGYSVTVPRHGAKLIRLLPTK